MHIDHEEGAGRQARVVDVAVVGAGIGGATAARALGRSGYRVALVDLHETFPPSFRCEKVSGEQPDLLRATGIYECAQRIATPQREVTIVRHRRIVEKSSKEELGFHYSDLVNAIRQDLPQAVDFVRGRVVDIKNTNDLQRVVLGDGSLIESRLLVLATGSSSYIREKIGIKRRVLEANHLLAVGFSLAPPVNAPFPFSSLAYFGETVANRTAYATIFGLESDYRINIFAYPENMEAAIAGFRSAPDRTLFFFLPGLQGWLGAFRTLGKPEVRPIDLYEVDNFRVPGVVLIGDAFRNTSPAAGNGVTRTLTDVDRLCKVFIPRWFATPGIGRDKIASFYDDPIKTASDRHCAYTAKWSRMFATSNELIWRLRRMKSLAHSLTLNVTKFRHDSESQRRTTLGADKG